MQANRKHKSLAELSIDWSQMTPEQQSAFQPCIVQPRIPLARPFRRPWPYCGDDNYPVSEENLEDVSRKVHEIAQKWESRIGKDCVPPVAKFRALPPKVCREKYGICGCKDTLLLGVKTSIESKLEKLDKWVVVRKIEPSASDQSLRLLPLFYIGPSDDAAAGSADEVPQGLLALMINPKPKGQVFLVNRHPPVKPGDVVHLVAQYAHLKSNVHLVEAWRGINASSELKLNCRQVGLLSYQILSTERMVDVVQAQMLSVAL